MKLADQPAFPCFSDKRPGMTLKQYYTGLAMQAYIMSMSQGEVLNMHMAVGAADKLILALEEDENNGQK